MANKLLYFVLMAVFLLFSVSKIWWETPNKRRVYSTMELVDKLFKSGKALLHIGFDEDQEYFKSYFLLQILHQVFFLINYYIRLACVVYGFLNGYCCVFLFIIKVKQLCNQSQNYLCIMDKLVTRNLQHGAEPNISSNIYFIGRFRMVQLDVYSHQKRIHVHRSGVN